MAIDLTRTHPDFAATMDDRTRSRDLYEGTRAVRAKKTTYLHKGRNESDDFYDLRLKRAVVDQYVGKIVTARQALLFRKDAERELPPKCAALATDVDLRGSDAGAFFQSVAREAQIDGVAWVLVDAPRAPEGGFASAAAEAGAGMRPFFELVPAGAVIDWETGPDRALRWAVVAEAETNHATREAGDAISVEPRWKVWTRDGWRLYAESKRDVGSGEDERFVLIEEGTHRLGQVPLVPFVALRHTDFSGWPIARDVLDHVLLLYNKQSELDWYELLGANPIPVVTGPEKPEIIESTKGVYLRSEQGIPASAHYLEPSGSGFQALKESILSLKGLIFSIALAQARKESAQVQSAESQREDRRDFVATLSVQAQTFENAERRCWNLMARWFGESKDAHVDYNKDFDDQTVETAMVGALGNLVISGVLTARSTLEILKAGEVLPETFDVDEEIAALEARALMAPITPMTDDGAGGQE